MSWIRQTAEGVVLELHVQPNAKRTVLAGRHGEALKIKLAAAPHQGKANDELIRFLSKLFGVPKSQIEILSGRTSRSKRVLVRGLDLETAQSTLETKGVEK